MQPIPHISKNRYPLSFNTRLNSHKAINGACVCSSVPKQNTQSKVLSGNGISSMSPYITLLCTRFSISFTLIVMPDASIPCSLKNFVCTPVPQPTSSKLLGFSGMLDNNHSPAGVPPHSLPAKGSL